MIFLKRIYAFILNPLYFSWILLKYNWFLLRI